MKSLFFNFLKDLHSIRVQLIYMSFLLNAFTLYGVIFRGIDYKVLSITFASMMVLFHYYFKSKELEHASK